MTRLNEKGYKDLKIMLITVVRFSPEERESLTQGHNIVDYITKPFGIKDLMDRIQKALNKKTRG